MPLTAEQVEQVNAWLRNQGGSKSCAECGGRSFEVLPEYLMMPFAQVGPTGTAIEIDRGAAVVAVTCLGCAHVRLFSPHYIGLLPKR